MSNDNDIRSMIIIEADQRSASEASRQLALVKNELLALESAGNNIEIVSSNAFQGAKQNVDLLASSVASLSHEIVEFGSIEAPTRNWQQEIDALKQMEQMIADIKAQGGVFEFEANPIFQERLSEFEQLRNAFREIKSDGQFEFRVTGNVPEQLEYIERFQRLLAQLEDNTITAIQTDVSSVTEATSAVSSLNESTASLLSTQDAVLALTASVGSLNQEMEQVGNDHNRAYWAEQIAQLEQLQSVTEDVIPSIQDIQQNLNDTAKNIEAIKVPREDIFGPYIDSAQELAEETRKAAEEAKKIGADKASQENIGPDKRSEEALKTINATTKALADLRKENIISQQAWKDASTSAWELYGSLNDIAKEITRLEQTEIDIHDTERVTQHQRELMSLRSTYASLKELLGGLPDELIEGLREAVKENEKLAQKMGNTSSGGGIGSLRSDISTFSTLSNRVGLGSAGDFRIAGDLIEVIDSLPDLKASLAGIPSSIGGAVAAIGTPFGLGMLGAIGALAIGIKLFTDETRRREEEIAEIREKNKRSSEDATQVGLGALDIYAQVMTEGTVAAADAALKDAETRIRNAQIINDKLSEITDNEDQINVIGFYVDQLRDKRGMDFDLDYLRSEAESDNPGNASARHAVKLADQIMPILDAVGISFEEFIKDTEAGMAKVREAQHTNSLELQQAEAAFNLVTGAVDSGVLALNSYEETQRAITDRRLEDAERVRAATMEEAQLSKASSSELENRLGMLELEEVALQKARGELMSFGEETEEISRQISTYTFQLIDNQRMQEKITNDYLDTAKQRELAAEIEKESAQAVIKYNRDVATANKQYQDGRVASERRLSDDLLRIEDRRVQQIERALEQLAEREASITLKSAREEEDQLAKLEFERQQKTVKIEREELKAEMDHARKVRDIREKSADQEFNLLLKRDFAGLFALRQRTDKEIKTAERASDEASKAREQSRSEQEQDEAAKLAFDRQQRQIRYQREIADAHAQAQRAEQQAWAQADREIQIANSKHRTQLEALNKAKWDELGILKKGIHNEIAELQRGSTARVRAEAETQAALMQAQRIGMINRVNASYNQPIYQLPAGYTGRNSVVNNVSNANNFTINGNNVREIQRVVMDVMNKVWGGK